MESEDAFEDEDVGAVHGHRLGLAPVSDEVVDRDVYHLALLQTQQRFPQQSEVYGIWRLGTRRIIFFKTLELNLQLDSLMIV